MASATSVPGAVARGAAPRPRQRDSRNRPRFGVTREFVAIGGRGRPGSTSDRGTFPRARVVTVRAAVADPRGGRSPSAGLAEALRKLMIRHTKQMRIGGAAALSLWLAAHLPLATSVRTHLLACQCPLKRAQDCVDAMRLLSEEGHGADRYNAAGDPDSLPKFRVVYDTAEASGCELEPPRSIVDWARRT